MMEVGGAALGGLIGHASGVPLIGELAGFTAGGMAKGLGQRQATDKMRSMLNPTTENLVSGPTATQAQRAAIAAALARINRPLIPAFASQATQ